MKTTLPTLSEFVDKIAKQKMHMKFSIDLAYIFNYNEFLKQPLKLEMFIPCKDGVPLEEPNEIGGIVQYPEEYEEYQKAKERVIFKGFHHVDTNGFNTWITLDSKFDLMFKLNGDSFSNQLISDLSEKVELTESKYNELNLK